MIYTFIKYIYLNIFKYDIFIKGKLYFSVMTMQCGGQKNKV